VKHLLPHLVGNFPLHQLLQAEVHWQHWLSEGQTTAADACVLDPASCQLHGPHALPQVVYVMTQR
jgi:hypothetical protein